MQFLHPGTLYRFEIPDAWLDEAGACDFVPRGRCYAWRPDPLWPVTVVDVQRVELAPGAPPRLERARMVEVLKAMVRDIPLSPLGGTQDPRSGRTVLAQGMHRLHAALALRYRQVPVALAPRFEL